MTGMLRALFFISHHVQSNPAIAWDVHVALVVPSQPWLAEGCVNYLQQLYWGCSQTMDWPLGGMWEMKLVWSEAWGLGKTHWAMALKNEKVCLQVLVWIQFQAWSETQKQSLLLWCLEGFVSQHLYLADTRRENSYWNFLIKKKFQWEKCHLFYNPQVSSYTKIHNSSKLSFTWNLSWVTAKFWLAWVVPPGSVLNHKKKRQLLLFCQSCDLPAASPRWCPGHLGAAAQPGWEVTALQSSLFSCTSLLVLTAPLKLGVQSLPRRARGQSFWILSASNFCCNAKRGRVRSIPCRWRLYRTMWLPKACVGKHFVLVVNWFPVKSLRCLNFRTSGGVSLGTVILVLWCMSHEGGGLCSFWQCAYNYLLSSVCSWGALEMSSHSVSS